MPFVIVNRERFALPIGETRVGGSGDDALPFPELAPLGTVAVLSVMPDGTATVQRAGDASVALNGQALGNAAVPLRHGARIEAGGFRLVFGDLRDAGSTVHVSGVTDDERLLLAADGPGEPTADSGGRLTSRASGTVIRIPEEGIVIGRDPECDVVVGGKDVSRRHASIRPSLQGYVLTDLGANGSYVNGRRVDVARVLGMRDVVRIGDEEFVFEADAASFEPRPELRPRAATGPATPSPTPASALASALAVQGAPKLLATLEIISRGMLEGKRFRVERSVVRVGRGADNDVVLTDDTVSSSHATLARRGSGWVLMDHDSTNGTYIDGDRMRGERPLPTTASELRFGGIKMVFRPIAGPGEDDAAATRVVVGVSLGQTRKRR
jgi:pSer/pThr/pTyr-binding forkhead associated (FHA) protein